LSNPETTPTQFQPPPRRDLLLSPAAVNDIDWPRREIRLNITREQVKTSPPWEPEKMIDQMYEKSLHRHYNWLGGGY